MNDKKSEETEIKIKMCEYFDKWFYTSREVYTKTNDKRNFIDILLYHHSDLNKEYPIGIEVKLTDKKGGSELGKWQKQSQRYSESDKNIIKPLIIVWPQFSGLYLEEGSKVSKHNVFEQSFYSTNYELHQPHQHNVNSHIFKTSGIGELQKFNLKNVGE